MKQRPHVKIHTSIRHHRKTVARWHDAAFRGQVEGLFELAQDAYIARRLSALHLGPRDVAFITGLRRPDSALAELVRLCLIMEYPLSMGGVPVVAVTRGAEGEPPRADLAPELDKFLGKWREEIRGGSTNVCQMSAKRLTNVCQTFAKRLPNVWQIEIPKFAKKQGYGSALHIPQKNKGTKEQRNKGTETRAPAEAVDAAPLDSPEASTLCSEFWSALSRYRPTLKPPSPAARRKWVTETDRLLRLDPADRNPAVYRELLAWMFAPEVADGTRAAFWRDVIRSAPGMRKHWDRLTTDMEQDKRRERGGRRQRPGPLERAAQELLDGIADTPT